MAQASFEKPTTSMIEPYAKAAGVTLGADASYHFSSRTPQVFLIVHRHSVPVVVVLVVMCGSAGVVYHVCGAKMVVGGIVMVQAATAALVSSRLEELSVRVAERALLMQLLGILMTLAPGTRFSAPPPLTPLSFLFLLFEMVVPPPSSCLLLLPTSSFLFLRPLPHTPLSCLVFVA